VCCSVLQCVAVCCSVLQCVAVCCSVLQPLGIRCRSLLRCDLEVSLGQDGAGIYVATYAGLHIAQTTHPVYVGLIYLLSMLLKRALRKIPLIAKKRPACAGWVVWFRCRSLLGNAQCLDGHRRGGGRGCEAPSASTGVPSVCRTFLRSNHAFSKPRLYRSPCALLGQIATLFALLRTYEAFWRI